MRHETAAKTQITLARHLASLRPRRLEEPDDALRHALRTLAKRWQYLNDEAKGLTKLIILFPCWGDLQDYADHDPAGRDLQPLATSSTPTAPMPSSPPSPKSPPSRTRCRRSRGQRPKVVPRPRMLADPLLRHWSEWSVYSWHPGSSTRCPGRSSGRGRSSRSLARFRGAVFKDPEFG
jgi:hypothetical protein